MAQQQEFNPIDQLFQQKFGALPESPASNGWDTPSDRVWQGIQGNLQPKPTAWVSWKLVAGVCALAVAAVGTYWVLRSNPSSAPTTAPVTEQPVSLPPAASEESASPVVAPPANTVESAKLKSKSAAPSTKPAVTAPTQPAVPSQAEPGTKAPNSLEKAKSPNSLEKRLQEEREKANQVKG